MNSVESSLIFLLVFHPSNIWYFVSKFSDFDAKKLVKLYCNALRNQGGNKVDEDEEMGKSKEDKSEETGEKQNLKEEVNLVIIYLWDNL